MRPVVDHETDKDSHTSTMKETIQSNPPTSVKVGMKRKADDLGSPEPKRPKSAPVNPIKTGSPAADETTDSAALATAHSKRKLEDDAPEPIPAKRIKIKVIKFSQSNSSGDEEENEPPATPAASEASDDTDFVPDRFLTVRDSLSPSRLSSDSDDDASLTECSMSIVSSDDDESVILPLPTAEPKSDSNNNNNNNNKTFPFLRLPPEIRIKIYSLLFDNSKPIRPPIKLPGDRTNAVVAEILDTMARLRHQHHPPRWGFRRGLVRSLALTNRQLSAEVLHHLYSSHTFSLTVAHHRGWVGRIGRRNASSLRAVALAGCTYRAAEKGGLGGMLATLAKRGAAAALRRLALLEDDSSSGGGLAPDSAFLVRRLLRFGAPPPARNGWRAFRALETIDFVLPAARPPAVLRRDAALYRELVLQAWARVRVRIGARVWLDLGVEEVEAQWLKEKAEKKKAREEKRREKKEREGKAEKGTKWGPRKGFNWRKPPVQRREEEDEKEEREEGGADVEMEDGN